MDFALSDEQREIQALARDFAAAEIEPNAAQWDRDHGFPMELLGKLADRAFANVSEALRSDLVAYYGDLDSLPVGTAAEQKRATRIRQQFARLDAR